jgi:hypothetical protein
MLHVTFLYLVIHLIQVMTTDNLFGRATQGPGFATQAYICTWGILRPPSSHGGIIETSMVK